MTLIGVNPYEKNKSAGDSIQEGINSFLNNPISKEVQGLGGALITGDWDTLSGELHNTSQLLTDMATGENDLSGVGTSLGNKVLEGLGLRDGGYVTLDNMPVHVEPGSLIIQPKLNIAETDMYLDGEDGKSYTYVQWLNTTGLKINMTVYSRLDEKPQLGTDKSKEGETKNDYKLFDLNTKVHDVLLEWARSFYKIEFWANFGMRNIKGTYYIYDIKQTVMNHEIVKSELELHEYTQDTMDDTFYKNYNLDDLTGKDMSKDTTLASRIQQIPETSKTCSCTPPAGVNL